MDHYSLELMNDIVLEGRGVNKENKSNSKKVPITKPSVKQSQDNAKPGQRNHVSRKVEMQILQISENSEKQLYDTLKQISGPDFKLADATEFKKKVANLSGHYWMQRGNLVIKGVTNYSAKDNVTLLQDQITKQFATSKLESYSFHSTHCEQALNHTNGNVGKALEILFYKYYGLDKQQHQNCTEDKSDFLQRRSDEKEALESIYGDSFVEEIKNKIWTIKLKLDYLVKSKDEKPKIKTKPKLPTKDVCRLFMVGKCRFGIKCRFLHQQPTVEAPPPKEPDSEFMLEIRFPEGSQYPFEPPYIFFYKNDSKFSRLKCLRIGRRLYEEAFLFCVDGTPSIFPIISLLEDAPIIEVFLEENKEEFLDKNDLLFPKTEEIENILGSSHYEKGSTNKRTEGQDSWDEIVKQDDEIRTKFMDRMRNPQYQKMKKIRRTLPAWMQMNEVLETIQEHQVTVISGDTGCGKSTQIPQFILDDWLLNRGEEKEHAEIVCTQPRRISAIGVAERVAAERDERVGSTVGYQIRLESKMSKYTRLTYCTTGILLQRLSGDPKLKSVTHIIVDEVHERSVESDFLLMLLKDLVRQRQDLKVILMSATLKDDDFVRYFSNKHVPVVDIPGRTYPVEQIFLEDLIQLSNYVLEESSKFARRTKNVDWDDIEIEIMTAEIHSGGQVPRVTLADENLSLPQLVGRYPECSAKTLKNMYLMDHEQINLELIEHTILWLINGDHDYPQTGSILVFLPGYAEIMALKDALYVHKLFSVSGKFMIIPLHSTLTAEEQALVFQKVKPNVRKIVLSTNIAETSITIEDCVFVIDTGRMKETRFNPNLNMASLEMCWISQANAIQRKGRAGRVMPGVSIHLYTSHRFKHRFTSQPIPEILRIPLEPLLLRVAILNEGKPCNFVTILGKMLEPPDEINITSAAKRLQDVGAFNQNCALTPLGHHLAALPVDVRIGKLIVFGAIFCCVDSALTIAACLSHKSPFINVMDKKYEVDAKKKEYATANSDQLTTLKAYRKWLEVSARGYAAAQAFAYENFLSVRTLQTLADIKHQLLELLVSIGFLPVNIPKRRMGTDRVFEITGPELNANNENWKLLQGLLCAALYPNVVKVFTPEKSFQVQSAGAVPRQPKAQELRFLTKQDGPVNIHPSSINFGVSHFTTPYLVYQEKIKTSKVFIREVSMVPALALILFAAFDTQIECHGDTTILSLEDGWILFAVESHRVAQLLKQMRIELVELLQQKMQDPLLNLLNHQNGKKIINTIVNVVTKE